ncbi:MAG: fatty acid desaturase [Myxococcales bacterium]|nr:fatty acid desaturase [Myxococcales bacterium]
MARAGPSATDVARALTHLEPTRWFAAAAVDWAVIALTFLLVGAIDHPLAYALAIIPLGSRQQALGALFHDAAHFLVSGKRWHNDVAGNLLAAWPLGLTLGGYRRYHFAHHRHLGSPDDPENHHKGLLRQWPLPARPGPVLGWFVSDLLGGGLPHLLAAGKLTRPTRIGEALGLLAFWAAVGACFWRLDALWVPILWVVSIATVFWSGVRLRIWTEHLGTRSTHRIAVPEWVEQLIMPHNIGLHYEHHLDPRVPFYHLSALRQALPEPPIVSLRALARAFVTSERLASGEVGSAVAPRSSAVATPPRRKGWRSHILLPLAIGVALYALLRPRGLLAHAWLERLGLPAPGLALSAGPLAPIVACLPSALWSYALTATVARLWRGREARARRGWLAATLVVVVGWELGQAAALWGGFFSAADLLASIVAFAAAVRYSGAAGGAEPSEQDHRQPTTP